MATPSQPEPPCHNGTGSAPAIPGAHLNVPSRVRVDTTAADFDSACQVLGFAKLRASKLAAMKTLGAKVSSEGAISVGRGLLLMQVEDIGDAIETINEALLCIDDPGKPEQAELLRGLLGLKATFGQQRLVAAGHLIKSAEIDQSDGANKIAPRTFNIGKAMVVMPADPATVAPSSLRQIELPSSR